MLDLTKYILPKDEHGNEIREPLLWYLPTPCGTTDMVVDEMVAFNDLVRHIILARLNAEGTHHHIDSLGVSELVSPCRGKTSHVYEVGFGVMQNAVRSKMREDLQAAVPLGVKKVVVGVVITPLLNAVPEGRQGLPFTPQAVMPTTYYVHCQHNRRYAGNAIPRKPEDYVVVKEYGLWP